MHPAVILIAALLAVLLLLSFARRGSGAATRRALGLVLLVLGLIAVAIIGIRFHWGIGLVAALPLLFRAWRQLQAMSGRYSPTPGQTSTVETDYIRMVVDLDSGEMNGTVLQGSHAGAAIDELDLESLLSLLEECRDRDPQGARVLETFIERKFPDAFDGEEHAAEPPPGRDPSSHITRSHALEILGLEEGASDDDVVEAHRRLMQKLHPDRGGSDYLAAQINRAKEVLLEG